MKAMLPLPEAQKRLLDVARPLEIEHVSLLESLGRWLAEPLTARRTQPADDLSAMDGWAINAADLPGPFDWSGRESAAGRPDNQPLGRQEAVRIFTGAVMPVGADTVVMQEEASVADGKVSFRHAPRAGTNVRGKGSDFSGDALLGDTGQMLTPARIALLAMGGHGLLPVRRRPRVAVLSTGDELIPAGAPLTPGKLPASNSPMLMAMIASVGADPIDLGLVSDDMDALVAAFARAQDADVLITSGGVSVGDHDLVRPALEKAGATLDFWRVALRPGKPLMTGRLGNSIVIGLPGNPVSSFVTAHLFALPLLRALAGAAEPLPPYEKAVLGAPMRATGVRTEIQRARLDGSTITPFVAQDSGALLPLAEANALIHRPAHAPEAASGEIVEILRIA